MNDRDSIQGQERYLFAALACFALVCVIAAQCSCGGQSVQPSNDLATAVKTANENQLRMEEKIDQVGGDLVKVQQTMNTFITNITNVINQKFETFQKSQRLEFQNFTGEMKTINSSSTNTTMYGIGLVAVVLIFALLLIWGMARLMRAILLRGRGVL